MKIKSIFVNGFKNIINTRVELSKITSLLSINSYGKSNLLSAFEFGTEFIGAVPKIKNAMMSYTRNIPLNNCNKYEDFSFETELEYREGNILYYVDYSYTFRWNVTKEKGAKILSEYLKIRNPQESSKYTLLISRDEKGPFYKQSETGRCDSDIIIEDNELIVNKISAFDRLYYLKLIKAMNEIKVYIDRHYDFRDPYVPTPFIVKGTGSLSLNRYSDVPRALYTLKTEHPGKYDLIINTLKTIFPFITDVVVKELKLQPGKGGSNIGEDAIIGLSDRLYTLYAQHEHMAVMINFAGMSDGVRRVLIVLTYIVLAQINNVVLVGIEEPENSINPGIMRRFLIALDGFADDCGIIMSSHSPFLINYVNPADIYVAVPNADGKAIFRKFRQGSITKLLNNAKSLDMLAGEYIFDLMSGSKEDSVTLRRLLENE